MRKYAAVLALGATLVFGATQAGGQTDPGSGCTPLKRVYSEKHWRQADPGKGVTECPARDRADGRRTVHHFYEYRHYRQIATMRCLPGREGYFVPNPGSCSTLECESGLSWWSVNTDSGAEWVYQLLGNHSLPRRTARWLGVPTVISGGPSPDSFHDRLVNHEIAATLGRGSWVC